MSCLFLCNKQQDGLIDSGKPGTHTALLTIAIELRAEPGLHARR